MVRKRLFILPRILIPLLLLILVIVNASRAAEALITSIRKPWTGDLDQMIEHRSIRALVPYSDMFYYLDGPNQKGLTYEAMLQFEKYLNEKLKTKHLKIKVVVIPTPRDRLLSDLIAGFGDLAGGNLTITDARKKLVDFSIAPGDPVDEVLVTGLDQPPVNSLFDLAGRTVYSRTSSSYHESLLALNSDLQKFKKKKIRIQIADEYLDDEDLLEMVNAGLIPAIVVDSHKAAFWSKVYDRIKIYPKIKLRRGGKIAWAFRKNSPRFAAELNEFLGKNTKGTLLYNILHKRYLEETDRLTNNTSTAERKKFNQTVELFERYGKKYDLDYLLLMALAYQESGLDQRKKSKAGAIGIMQVLPSTAAGANVGIKKIEQLENNIHAGTKYLHFMINRYFQDEKIDRLNRGLFAFASYNAGPAKVNRLREEAAREGYDPDLWFDNVEVIAAKRIGRETVQYVGNIYKYYIAYKLIDAKERNKEKSKDALLKELGGTS